MKPRSRIAALNQALIVASVAILAASLAQARANEHLINCINSPSPSSRPANVECAILERKQIEVLPTPPIVWRFETFRSRAAAQRAQTTAGVLVHVAGKEWLLTLAEKGERSRSGSFVAEVGPLKIPPARRYEIVVGEAYSAPGAVTRVHVHPGPEAWYLLAGAQCLEVPHAVLRADAAHGMFVAASTPMKLTATGTAMRDAIFLEIGDATRRWTGPVHWTPLGRCRKAL